MQLAIDAGRGAEAAMAAVTVRRWLQRIAVTLDQRLTLVLGIYAEGFDMIADDARIRHRLNMESVAGPNRSAVLDCSIGPRRPSERIPRSRGLLPRIAWCWMRGRHCCGQSGR